MHKYKLNLLSAIYQIFSLVSIVLTFGILIYFILNKQFYFRIAPFAYFFLASLVTITLAEFLKLLSNIKENTEKIIDNNK